MAWLMQVTETLSESLKRGFNVLIEDKELEEKRQNRLSELGKKMDMPGFRPGKIPLSVVKQRYGASVQNEVVNEMVRDSIAQILNERGLRPAIQPHVVLKDESLQEGHNLEFSFEVELVPEFTIPDLSDISLTRLKSTPSEDAIQKALENIASRQRELKDIEEDRPAAKGDILIVDFVGKVDGVEFDGGKGQDVAVELGGSGFIPGFSEQMEGMKRDEKRDITVTFPTDYQATHLAGKEAVFSIHAKALKEGVVPAIDDEMAKKIGLENLDRLKEAVSKQISSEYDQASQMRLKRDLLDVLAGKVDFEVPPGLLKTEFDQIWQHIENERKAGRLDEEDAQKDEETLKSDYHKIAERRVRLGLLLAEIGVKNGISVTQDELLQAMRAEAMRYPGREKEVIEFFRNNPQAVESLRGPLFENKVVNYIIELAKVEDKEVTPEELAEVPPSTI